MTSVADRPGTTSAPAPTPADVVARMRASFDAGRTRPVAWRARQLEGLRRFCEEREPDIAQALAEDLGRNAHDAWFGDIAATVGEASYALKHLKRWVRPTRTAVPLALLPGRGSYRYEPLGVVLVIGAWNYPFYLTLGPMVGAFAAGNAVVLKPSEHASASSRLLAEVLPTYLDQDAFAVVEGEAEVTQELIDARLDLIFFTGGTEIGRKVMAAAAKHLTPVVLELGGKSPVIVEPARRPAGRRQARRARQAAQLGPDLPRARTTCSSTSRSATRSSGTCAPRSPSMRAGEDTEQPIVNARQFGRLAGLLGSGEVVPGGTDAGARPWLRPSSSTRLQTRRS